jgi:hypothetical protein
MLDARSRAQPNTKHLATSTKQLAPSNCTQPYFTVTVISWHVPGNVSCRSSPS